VAGSLRDAPARRKVCVHLWTAVRILQLLGHPTWERAAAKTAARSGEVTSIDT
jgi:hypothetical protein